MHIVPLKKQENAHYFCALKKQDVRKYLNLFDFETEGRYKNGSFLAGLPSYDN